MSDVMVAVISATGMLIVSLINNAYQNSRTRDLIEYKLEELSKRVDKHNNVIERTYALEKTVEVLEERQKVANHRLEDLEAR